MSVTNVRTESGPMLEGAVLYVEAEYSFRFDVEGFDVLAEREGTQGRSSVEIGTLQVEVGTETGAALFVWGLHPRVKWRAGILPKPIAEPAAMLFEAELHAGASTQLAPVGAWLTVFDEASGWLRISPDNDADSLVAIATGTLLGHRGGVLHSVWLKPLII